ncbi:hypothetical protein FJT64_010600 [Amphibalanus amphitrite]|uniref:Uncharacterized protein n=1 Tax=Amphibalanus amphitrite TaxID=1232801 RepID=A0A6A4V4P4_AMPAM|nr:hypothetical protein FJT64_010600 [Amphibalanus amphitrite]
MAALRAAYTNPPVNEAFTPEARLSFRSMLRAESHSHRLVWRLATLYVATRWAKLHGVPRLNLEAEEVPISYLLSGPAAHTTAMQACRHGGLAPVVYVCQAERGQVASDWALLRTVAAGELAIRIPTAYLGWLSTCPPPLGGVACYTTVTQAVGDSARSATEESVEGLARRWCGPINCWGLFCDYVSTIEVLWFAETRAASPVYGTPKLVLQLPVFATWPHLALPFYSGTELDGADPGAREFAPAAECFVRGATRQLLLALGVRQFVHLAVGPAAYLLAEGKKALTDVGAMFAQRGGTSPILAHAVQVLMKLGVDGHPGRVIMGSAGGMSAIRQIVWWMQLHRTAYHQWEEAGIFLDKLPANATIHGVLRPLRTLELLQPLEWYSVGVVETGRSAKEVFSTLCVYGGVELRHRSQD